MANNEAPGVVPVLSLDKREDKVKKLEERLKKLEDKKLKVADIPLVALKRALQQEPQDPIQTLLPHSVTRELLAPEALGVYKHTLCTGDITLAASNTALPGCEVSVNAGRYKVTAHFDTEITSTGIMAGFCTGGANAMIFANFTGTRETVSQVWTVQFTGPTVIKVFGAALSGAGKMYQLHSNMLVEEII